MIKRRQKHRWTITSRRTKYGWEWVVHAPRCTTNRGRYCCSFSRYEAARAYVAESLEP